MDISKEWADAATELGREHGEGCECQQCEFAFRVFIVACGGSFNENDDIRWNR